MESFRFEFHFRALLLPNPAVCNLRRGFSARQVSCQVANTGIAEPFIDPAQLKLAFNWRCRPLSGTLDGSARFRASAAGDRAGSGL
jgi:hypothetical protein